MYLGGTCKYKIRQYGSTADPGVEIKAGAENQMQRSVDLQ